MKAYKLAMIIALAVGLASAAVTGVLVLGDRFDADWLWFGSAGEERPVEVGQPVQKAPIAAGKDHQPRVTDHTPTFTRTAKEEEPATPPGAKEAGTDVYVNAATGSDDNDCSAATPCLTIQKGIDTVETGGTVHIAAGTFAENLILNKKIILDGAGSGDDPETNTIIDPPGANTLGGSYAILMHAGGDSAADRLTIRDLRLTDAYAGIYFDSSQSFINVENVVSTGNTNGMELECPIATNTILISDLIIDGSSFSGNAIPASGHGLRISKRSSIDGLTVTNSHFDNNYRGWYGQRYGDYDPEGVCSSPTACWTTRLSNVAVTDTTFNQNRYKALYLEKLDHASFNRVTVDGSGYTDGTFAAGMEINLKFGTYSDILVENSTFTDCGTADAVNGMGLSIKARDDGSTYSANPGILSNVTVRGNVFSGNPTALRFGEAGKNNATPTNVSATNNHFAGNAGTGIEMDNACQATVNAYGNWYGSYAGSTVASRIGGSVDFTPWLHAGTDTSTDAGFQPDLSYLHVDDASPQVGTTGRIQEGIDLIADNGTVYLTAGEYTEPFLIDGKAVTVQGESKAAVLFKPTTALSSTTASYQNAIRVMNSTNTILDGMTMDFDTIKTNSRIGVRYIASSGAIRNCTVKNLSMPDSGSGYAEIALYLRTDSGDDTNRTSIDVLNNEFIDAGRVGVLTHYWVTTNITGNTFTKTFDDFGYAINVGSQSESTITNNVISGYDTPAASDNSASSGIYIENCFTGGLSVTKNVSVTGNEIYGCQGGLLIGNEFDGYAGDVDIVATVANNNIHDNWGGGAIVADEDKEAGSSVNVTFTNNTLLNNTGTGPGSQPGNGIGYDIRTYGDGDITASFNGETISGQAYDFYVVDGGTTSSSSYAVTIHDSNILGGKTISGVINALTDGTVINATGNWWGDYAGPYHATTNPNALGSTVSDNVDYGLSTTAWSQAPESDLECPGCLIGGVCYNVGQTDSTNVCLICQTAGATAWANNNGVTCDDALWCNGADTCGGGTCSIHAGDQCSENNNVCDGITSCDEDNNQCVTSPVLTCDDGQWCNGAETCNATTGCVAGTPPDCSATDYLSCTVEECNETADACVHTYTNTVNPCVVSPGGSIQTAINTVDAGTTVQVEAGTYDLTAAIQINKALTLLGDATTPENVIINAATISGYARWGVRVQADNVTVQGFHIQGASQLGSSINYNSTAILVGALGTALVSNVQVLDNELTDSSYGVYLNDVHNVTVSRNEIWNIHTDQHWAGKGIEIYGQGSDPDIQNNGIDILDNEIHDCGLFGIELNHWDTATGAWVDVDILIQGNVFHDNGGPLDALGYPYDLGRGVSANGHEMGVTINDNEFYNHWAGNKASIRLYPDTAGVRINDSKGFVITNNVFHDNMRGLEIHGDDATTGYPDANTGYVITGNVFHHNAEGLAVQARGTGSNNIGYAAENSFYDNDDTAKLGGTLGTAGPYNITAAGATDTFNASGNWFESANLADYAATIAGDIDFTPWLHAGTDISTDAGFQPDLSYLHVDDASPQVGTTGRIQEAIGLIDEQGTVLAHAGLYDERLLINKPLTLLGATNGVPKKGYVVPALYAYDTATETVIKPSTDLNWPVIGIGFASIGGGSLALELSAPLTIDGVIVANEVAVGGGSRDLIYVGQKVMAPSGIEVANSVLGPNTNSTSQPGTNGRSCFVMAGPHKAQVKLLINNNKIFDAKGDGCGIMLVGAYSLTYGEYAYSLNALAGSVIENNEITGNHRTGLEMAAGVQGSATEPFIISNNLIANNGWRDLSESAQLKYGNGLTCQRSGGDKGNADALGCQYLLIQNNEIRDNEKNGVYLGPMSSELTFSGNLFSNNGSGVGGYLKWDAVRLDLTELYYSTASNGGISGTPVGYQGVLFPANIVFDGNNIMDIDATRPTPTEYGINVIQVATNPPAGTVLATGNWWGDYTGPYHVTTNPAALGSAVTDYVDYGQGEPLAWSQIPEGDLGCPGCLIGGVCYNIGQANPANICLYCAATGTAWADNDGVTCDDTLWCNGADTCSNGSCSAHASDQCVEDSNVCNGVISCDEENDQCVTTLPLTCDDGQWCNGAETCNATTGCVAGTPPDCSATDYLSCTLEECEEATDTCVHTYSNAINPCVVSPGGSIQAAIDLVDTGTTVQAVAGTFAENVLINKYVMLDGAGSGADPASDTIIDPPSGHAITIKTGGSGLSATDRMIVSDLRVTGAAQGVRFDSGATIKWVTLRNVAAVGNTEPGFNIRETSTYEDLRFENIVSTNNSAGLQIQSTATVITGLVVDGGTLSNNTGCGFLALGGTLDDITIRNAAMANNAPNSHTNGDIVITGFNGDLEISDVTITSDNSESAIRVTGASSPVGPTGTVLLKGIDINGTQAAAGTYPSAAIVLSRFSSTTGVSFENVTLASNAPAGLFLGTLYEATTPPSLNLADLTFSGTYGKYIQLGQHGNSTSYAKSNANVDATDVVFTGVTDPFAIEDGVDHQLDDEELGLVTWTADNVYVTENSGSIQRGIDAAGATGWTVNVAAGTYNEKLAINKAVSLLGAQAGVDARGRTGNESIIDFAGAGSYKLIEVTASNVVIDGFSLTCPTSETTGGIVGITVRGIGAYTDNVKILNNIIKNLGSETAKAAVAGIEIGISTDNVEVAYNEIADLEYRNPQDSYPAGIMIWGSNGDTLAKNTNVHDNYIHDIILTGASLPYGSKGIQTSMYTQNATISRNEIANASIGFQAHSLAHGTINLTENNIHDCVLQGLRLGAPVTLSKNTVTANPIGIYAKNFGSTFYTDLNITAEMENNIYGNANYGIQADPGAAVILVNATNNWWGAPSGPYHPTLNPSGTGNPISDNVYIGEAGALSYLGNAYGYAGEGDCPLGTCEIAGVCYADGVNNPGEQCQECNVASSTTAWTNLADGTVCDDGDVCDGTDTCGGGACSVHVDALDCDDSNICTDDSCDAVLGCQYANNTLACDDGTFCNGADTCNAGSCAVHAGDPCPENSDVCDGITSCNETDDRCDTSTAPDCDDHNQCTDDSCDPITGCANTNDDTNTCEDGLFCTANDTCNSGICLAGPARDCDDGVSCTDDSCNDDTDTCDYAPNGDPTCEVEPGGNVQNALDAANPGDVVLLADTIFYLDDPLVISKSLILRGQGTGTTTFDGGTYGATCDPDGIGDTWPRAIHVTANDVTIDHVKIRNYQGDRVNCWGYGVLARGAEAYSGVSGGTTITGLHVQEAEFVDVTLGVRISETDGAVIEDSTYEVNTGEPADAFHLNFSTNALIQNNVITDGNIWVAKGSHNARILNNSITDAPANCIWAGVNFTGDDLSNSPTIVGNTLNGCYEGGIVLWGKSGEVTTDAVITDNTITGVQGTYDHHGGISIFAGEYQNLVIRDNVSKENSSCDCHTPGTATPGLKLRSTTLTSATIQGNTFADNLGQGVLVSKVTRVAVDMRFNSIHGNDLGGVEVSQGSGTDVDARGSWWGNVSGPYHATTNPTGTGDSISNYVLFGEYATAEPGTVMMSCRGEVGSYCLTNVSSAQMSVSWSTFGANEKGYVLFGESPTSLDQTYYDDRDDNTYDENHHVTIKLLSPATTYYFAIVTGGVVHQNGAQPFTAATGPSIGLPVGGDKLIQVQKAGGGTAARGALAYAKLKNDLNEAPDPSLGESVWLSTVIDNDDGLWGVPLGNFREIGLDDYFTYEGLDNIFVFADGAQDGFSTWEGNIEDGIPVLVLNDCDGCYVENGCYDQGDKPTPVAPLTDTCEICDIARSRSAWSPDAAGILCRPETPICDVAEYCTGTSTGCPIDTFQAAGTVCDPDSGNLCDAPDVCAGDSATCVVTYEPTSTVCRPLVNNCDVAENCTGASEQCPDDAFEPTTKVCLTKGSDPCDADDYCQGDAAVCVVMYAPSTTECRAVGSQGVDADCDVAEFCTGSANDCPTNGFQAVGFSCDDSDACSSPDVCDGAGSCDGPANSGPFITVTDPDPGSSYAGGGGSVNVIWDYGACPIGAGNGVDNIDIYASMDGGASYPVMVKAGAPDTGTYAWTLPAINIEQLRLKVEARAGGSTTGSDAMDGDFAVYMPTGLTITLDTDGKVVLTWDGGSADIYYSNDPYAEDPSDWSLIGEGVSSGWKDHTSLLVPDTFYRLTNADKAAFSAEVAGKTKTTLNAGYTLITPPYQEMSGALSAQELLESIGTTAKSVMQWDAGAQWWNIHYRQYPNYNNFNIKPGCGYFVEIDGASTYWISAGTLIQDQFATAISFDYTLMGFPTGEMALAQNVLDEVTAQGGNGHSIYQWDAAGWWNVHYDLYPDNYNFAIEPDNGYFVKNTNYTEQMDDFTFNPMGIEVTTDADGFTVAWATSIDASGWLLFYGDDPSSTPTVVLDDVNGLDQDTDHEVTVTGLTAGTYYFDLVVSGVTFDGFGNHHELTLP